jgi:hypothetical protein
MRQAGPFVSRDATIVAIDMAISDNVEPPGPVGVVVTDAEVLLVASSSDGGCLTRLPTSEVRSAAQAEPDTVSLRVAAPGGDERKIVLDFRYFGVTDDTIAKLLAQFASDERTA